MSRFPIFIVTTLEAEGGYTDSKKARLIGDSGSATKYGISLKFLKGQKIHLADFNHDGLITERDLVVMTKDQAVELYCRFFWNPLYDMIDSELIAFKLFDIGVNTGVATAVKLLQKAVNVYMGGYYVQEDGVFGQATLRAVNLSEQSVLLERFILQAERYYRNLRKPNFIKGWLNRLKNIWIGFKWQKNAA